jgi:hypothetical protein
MSSPSFDSRVLSLPELPLTGGSGAGLVVTAVSEVAVIEELVTGETFMWASPADSSARGRVRAPEMYGNMKKPWRSCAEAGCPDRSTGFADPRRYRFTS